MFQIMHRSTGEARTVYGVHKSGPLDEQTKFLVHDRKQGWRWAWAVEFEPAGEVSASSPAFPFAPLAA